MSEPSLGEVVAERQSLAVLSSQQHSVMIRAALSSPQPALPLTVVTQVNQRLRQGWAREDPGWPVAL